MSIINIEYYNQTIKREAGHLKNYKENSDYMNLLNILDDLEMDPMIGTSEYKEWHLMVHLLAHILIWDPVNAKFLWKRADESLKTKEKSKSLFDVIRCIIRHEFDKIIPKLSTYWKSILGDETLEILCDKAVTLARYHLARILTKYYTNISLKEAANILTFSEKEAEIYLLEHEWEKLDKEYMQAPKYLDINKQEFKKILANQCNETSANISFMETL